MSQAIPYYGQGFYDSLAASAQDRELRTALQTVLWNYHQQTGALDDIVQFCDGEKCYTHVDLGYDRARYFLFGQFYLHDYGNGSYGIKDVYCDNEKVPNDFKKGQGPGPGLIPPGNVINVEHTWPQSKFSSQFDKDIQKSDLHHLFPADTRMNAARANLNFGAVLQPTQKLKCAVSRIGKSASGKTVFEPPVSHRGNVARALFYFAVQYNLAMDDEQEATMRQWNVEDPVDDEEIIRNQDIQNIQGNRNPFVDYPELIERISDF
jgi:hypothetical protein